LRAMYTAMKGVAGVSAGFQPVLGYPAVDGSKYFALGVDMNMNKNGGPRNSDLIMHLPSAMGFLPELPGMKDNLLRMANYGMGFFYAGGKNGFQPRAMWDVSLRYPAWKPSAMTMVDFAQAAFGLARFYGHTQYSIKMSGPTDAQLKAAGETCDILTMKPVDASCTNNPTGWAGTKCHKNRCCSNVTLPFMNDGTLLQHSSPIVQDKAAEKQWFAIKLGAMYVIKNITVHWEASKAELYDIEFSSDGMTWSTAASESLSDTDWQDSIQTSVFPTAKYQKSLASWVRIHTKQAMAYTSDNKWAYNIKEFKGCGYRSDTAV